MTDEQKARNIKLAEALESGWYKQTRYTLKSGDSYCCLGVACELYRLATGDGVWREPEPIQYDDQGRPINCFNDVGESGFLLKNGDYRAGKAPGSVAAYYGWKDGDPELTIGKQVDNASAYNDVDRRPFPDIAQGFRNLAA